MNGFGCQVLAFDRMQTPAIVDLGVQYVSLDELLRKSDIISLHVALTPETRYRHCAVSAMSKNHRKSFVFKDAN